MSKKNKVSYIENEEPSFIKQFKERIGYKEGPDVNTKRETNVPDFDEDDLDIDDEKPTIVVLKKGDLTAEEADKLQPKIEEPAHNIGDKIVFKKPMKRQIEEQDEADGETEARKEKRDKKTKTKSIDKQKKNNSLLSFDNEDDDEDV